jgi:hypothetical protein
MNGEPAVGSAFAIASKIPPYGPRAAILWTHGTVGIDRSCTPSLFDEVQSRHPVAPSRTGGCGMPDRQTVRGHATSYSNPDSNATGHRRKAPHAEARTDCGGNVGARHWTSCPDLLTRWPVQQRSTATTAGSSTFGVIHTRPGRREQGSKRLLRGVRDEEVSCACCAPDRSVQRRQ